MSLTLTPTDKPIAMLINPVTNIPKTIYLAKREEVDEEVKAFSTSDPRYFIITPALQSERVLIAAKSGAGKSYQAKIYMMGYKMLYPNNDIYLISPNAYDPTFEEVKHLFKIIDADISILSKDLSLEFFEDSLVVFDDVDTIRDKDVNRLIYNLLNDLASRGRHHDTYTIYLSHHMCDYSKTRTMIMEANKVVFFPDGAEAHIENFLYRKEGIKKDKIRKIQEAVKNSRWAMISLVNPYTIVYDQGIFIL